MNVDGLKGMLLSPHTRKYCNGYATCSVCYSKKQQQMATKKIPPKFSIAYGFVIELFPQKIQYSNKDGKRVTRKIEDYELTDLLKAMVAPVRPYGCVFAYSGGPQKLLQGNYQCFWWINIVLGGGDKSA